jgi:hypothetical protein
MLLSRLAANSPQTIVFMRYQSYDLEGVVALVNTARIRARRLGNDGSQPSFAPACNLVDQTKHKSSARRAIDLSGTS